MKFSAKWRHSSFHFYSKTAESVNTANLAERRVCMCVSDEPDGREHSFSPLISVMT